MITPDTILFKSIITGNINGNIILSSLYISLLFTKKPTQKYNYNFYHESPSFFQFYQTTQFFLKTLFSLESFP